MIGRYFLQGSRCTMMKSPKDAVFDWYINRERSKGGRIYERSVGIRPPSRPCAAATVFHLPIGITARGRRALFVPSSTTPRRPCRPRQKLGEADRCPRRAILACYDEDGGATGWRSRRRSILIPPRIWWRTSTR